MEELLDKVIRKVYIDEDKHLLLFLEKNDEIHLYRTSSDCCAKCWFESVNGIENIIDSQITGVENKDNKITHDYGSISNRIEILGYTLKSLKGYCDIEFRNQSNGFYAGTCEYISRRYKLSYHVKEGKFYLRMTSEIFGVDQEMVMKEASCAKIFIKEIE